MARFGLSGGWIARHRTAVVAWVALSVVATGLVVVAIRSQGYPVHRADLNNGGVWVTNSTSGDIGRENKPIKQLDFQAGASKPGNQLDVLQNQEAVVAVDSDSSVATPVDTADGAFRTQSSVSVKNPDVQLGGDVVADVDPDTGKLWATQVSTEGGESSLAALDPTSKPLLTVGGGAYATVSTSGTIYAASVSTRTLYSIDDVDGSFATPVSTPLDPTPTSAIKGMTTVGETAVWLDSSGHVDFAGHSALVGDGAVLQQAGPQAGSVLVDTPSKLVSVDLSSGVPTTVISADGATTASSPVSLGGCSWGLWRSSTTGYVARSCGGQVTRMSMPVSSDADLVYRVNRDNLFVNDITTGAVWDVDTGNAIKVSDWQQTKPRHHDNGHHPTVPSNDPPKPQAVPDKLGARAGDTTVLHVLDNDKAPTGSTLAITAVGKTDNAEITVAPDQQTILAHVDAGVPAGTPLAFSYTIDDGEHTNPTADGMVHLTVRGTGEPAATPRRRSNYTNSPPPVYPVATGQGVDLPVLNEWRDPANGDPVSLVSGSVSATSGKASITPDGFIRYVAPEAGGSGASHVTVSYETTTGGGAAKGHASLVVYTGTQTARPQAEPDVAAGTVGDPIVIHPLDNDVPGADPVDPTAKLALSGSVAPVDGLSVTTDPDAGTVTLIAHKAASYQLPYHVAYGSAAGTSGSQLRVIVHASSATSDQPVAMPDATALHGTAPMLVDVLANDYDPQGRLLAVQQATASQGVHPLSVSVIQGRWVRVSNPSGEASDKPVVVTYTISDGHAQASGTLTVSLLPAIDPLDDAPDAEPDVATVRAGTSVEIPVLDNDSTPSGNPLALVPDPTAHPIGTLPVLDGRGTAYLDGKDVRFVAPANGKTATDVHLSYVVANAAQSDAGESTGLITVHVTPPANPQTNPDLPPTPSDLEGRVVEGDTVTLELPLTGQDPDGDPVAVTGIGDASTPDSTPQLGQVTGYSADTITYQAFPGETGADQFSFTVTDPSGRSAEATARIAVVAAGAPQAPVAVDDTVTADPGRSLNIDVLANDLIPPGTTPQFKPIEDSRDGVTGADGLVKVTPRSRGTLPLVVPYTISDGLNSSPPASLTVHWEKGYDNPPTAGPVTATPAADAKTVTADVLAKVSDIDDAGSQLSLVSVQGVPPSAISDGSVTLPVTAQPRVLTYVVRDAEGAEAVGTIYEAGRSTKTPYLKKGAILRLAPGKATTFDIAKYVVTPVAGTRPYLTTTDELSQTPPTRFTGPLGAPDQKTLKVSAGTPGPASVTFEVSDQKHFNAKTAHSALISLPVLIGNPAPSLTCPSGVVPIPESGAVQLQVAAICHVWWPEGEAKPTGYTASNGSSTKGVRVSAAGGTVTVQTTHAVVGAQGFLEVGVAGSKSTAHLKFVITKLPPPVLQPLPVQHPKAGQTASLDLADFLQPGTGLPASAFDPTVLSVTPVNGGPAARLSGTRVSVTPPANEHLTYTYRVMMSDSGHGAGADRTASGLLSVQVTDVPRFPAGAAPSVVGQLPVAGQVTLRWPAASPDGLPLQGYTVKGGPHDVRCPTTTCTITGLKNETKYAFTVTAANANGPSGPIGPVSATPDAVPTQVTHVDVLSESEGRVVYQWTKPVNNAAFGPVTGYLVSWTGHAGYYPFNTTKAEPSLPVSVPNGQLITFSVRPINRMYALYHKWGPLTSNVSGVASGKPDTPQPPTVSGADVPGHATKALVVHWLRVLPNGRGKTHYEVFDGGTPVSCGGGSLWTGDVKCSLQVPNVGAQHSYTVLAANDAGVTPRPIEGPASSHQSRQSSPPTSAVAAGTPDGFSGVSLTPTGNDGQATLTFSVGNSHGSDGVVTCSPDHSCGTIQVNPNGDTVTRTVDGFTNGRPASITLTYCNGADPDPALGTVPCVSTTTPSVTTYGPIPQPTITPSVSGNSITVTASGSANGATATMTVRDTDTGASVDCGSSDSGWSGCQLTESNLAYSTTYHFTATVTDQGHGRGTQSSSTSATTGAQPRQVIVTRGTACGGGGGSLCKGGTCTDPSCAYVHVQLIGFTASASCSFNSQNGPSGWTTPITLPPGYNGDVKYWYGYPNTWVTVTCDGVVGRDNSW